MKKLVLVILLILVSLIGCGRTVLVGPDAEADPTFLITVDDVGYRCSGFRHGESAAGKRLKIWGCLGHYDYALVFVDFESLAIRMEE